MKRPSIGVALVVVVALLLYAFALDQRSAGAAAERAKWAAARVDTAARAVAKAETVYVRGRDRWRKAETLWDTVRLRDTVPVIVPGTPDTVEVYVPRAAADSVVNSCRSLVFACDARNAAKDSLTAALRQQIKAIESARPSRFSVWMNRALWFGAGRLSAGR